MWEEGARIYGTPGVHNNFPIDIDIDIFQIFTSLEPAHTTHTKPLKAELKNNLN